MTEFAVIPIPAGATRVGKWTALWEALIQAHTTGMAIQCEGGRSEQNILLTSMSIRAKRHDYKIRTKRITPTTFAVWLVKREARPS